MELIEILNPLEVDLQFLPYKLEFKEDTPISQYIEDSDKYCFVNIDQEELSCDYIVKDTDIIFFARNIGNKTAAIIIAVIAIIIISIFTFGSGMLAGGMFMTAGTATAAPALTFAGQMVFSLAMMALSVSLSILMAPKQPDMGEEKGDERSVYLWGQQHTINKQMIPIPILLGKFPTFGNMICSRTVPITDNSTTVFEPLAEYGYYQFGLCSNPISEIEQIYINKFNLIDMQNDDIAVFYTKGTSTQAYLYALPPNIDEYEWDGIYRFKVPPMVPGALPDNGQLEDYEPLNPGICIETVKNQVMGQPSHANLITVFNKSDKIYSRADSDAYNNGNGYITKLTSSAEMISPTSFQYIDLPLEVSVYPFQEIEKPSPEMKSTGSGYEIKYYTKEYDEWGVPTGEEDTLPYHPGDELLFTYYHGRPGGYAINERQIMLKGEILEEIEMKLPKPPKDPNDDGTGGGGRRATREDQWYPVFQYNRKGWKVRLYWATKSSLTVPDNVKLVWYPLEEMDDIVQEIVQDPHHCDPNDSNWHFWESTINYADSIEFEFVAPTGMFYEYIRNQRGGKAYVDAFVTFEWEIRAWVIDESGNEQVKGLYVTSERDPDTDFYAIRQVSTHPRSMFNNGTKKYIHNPEDRPWDGMMQSVFGIYTRTKLAFTRFVRLLQIIKNPYVKDLPGYPRLDYDTTNNKLWPGKYRIKVRIKNHGTYDIIKKYPIYFPNVDTCPCGKHGSLVSYYPVSPPTLASYGIVLPVAQQHQWNNVNDNFKGQETLNYTVNFFKIKEYAYMATCSYPYSTVAGIAFKATEAYNGRLPSMTFIPKGVFLVYKGTGDPEDFSNNWEYKFTTNPGYMCINLLFDSYYGAALGGSGSRSPQGSEEFNKCVERFLTRIDLATFIEFAEYCNDPEFIPGLLVYDDDPEREDYVLCEAPDPEDPLHEYDGKYLPKRYSCNGIIDKTKSILDWLGTILGSYDAFVTFHGLKLAVLFDKQLQTFVPKQIFTSSNIIKDSFKQSFMDPSILAKYVETTYLDEENLWEKTPVLYKPFGSLDYTGTNKTKVSVFGYTNVNRVIHRLHQILKKTSLLTQQIEFNTSTQGFTRRVGDPIGVTFEYIEWGVINNADDVVQASGRILKLTQVSEDRTAILLDRLIAFEDIPIDLADPNGPDRTIMIVSANDDSLFIQAKIYKSEIVFGKTQIEILTQPALNSMRPEDLFLLGETGESYKEAIITKVSFKKDNQVGITATVYDPAIWERGTLITEIFGNIFTKELVGVLDCTTVYHPDPVFRMDISWSPPVILSSATAINLVNKPDKKVIYPKIEDKIKDNDPESYLDQIRARYRVEFVTYKIYRMRVAHFDSSHDKDGINGEWEFLGFSKTPNYTETIGFGLYDYIYKITTTLKINGIQVDVPLSWNSQCIKRTEEHKDYLNKVKVLYYAVDQHEENKELYDLTLVIENSVELNPEWNNMLLAWVKVAGTSIHWVGNLAIRLVEDAPKGTGFISVNSIVGLPQNDKGEVFGLITINDEEIVMVDGHRKINESLYELRLRFYDRTDEFPSSGTAERRFSLGRSQLVGATVKNAHLGLYPVKYFAFIEDNIIESNPDSNYMTCESLYYFDYDEFLTSGIGKVRKVYPNEEKFRSEIEATVLSKGYPINIGTDNLITYSVKAGGVNPPINNRFFFQLARTPQYILDFEIGLAWTTMDGEPHSIKVAAIIPCPELPNLPVMKEYDSTRIYCTFKDIEVPSGSTLWVAVTHIQTLGEDTPSPYGYTSYPVLIDGDMT